MIRKPFRTPFLRKTEELGDDDGVSEPQTKKRRIISDEQDGVKRAEPRLVFKTPGISLLARKPLSAIEKPAGATETLDGGFDGYYNVLWYIHLVPERSDY